MSSPSTGPEVVSVEADDSNANLPLDALAGLLAEAVSGLLTCPVGVLHVGGGPPDPPMAAPEAHAWVSPGEIGPALRAWQDRSYIFVVGPDGGARTRTVRIGAPDSRSDLAPCLHTAVVGAPSPITRERPAVGVIARGIASAARGRSALPVCEATPYEALAPAWCRLHLAGLDALRRGPAVPSLSSLDPADRARMLGWARAVTGRRVGLAMGGAGAWGFGCVALIEALEARGVPVDLVSGASSGALIGAYYCAHGRPGLARLVRRGPAFARIIGMMALSTRPTAWMVDADLGELRLESLERPLLPVATDLRQLCPVVLTRGPLGFAVRASASAPGVFAPTRDGEVRYADGAVSDNAPFRPLEIAGADLVVVCNTLPAQRIRDRDGGLADRLSPLRRMGQLQQAFSLLLHRAGTPEANPNRVTYAAAPDPSPLEQTFRYGDAERYLDRARQDPRLAEAVSAVHAAWQVPRLNPALESRP